MQRADRSSFYAKSGPVILYIPRADRSYFIYQERTGHTFYAKSGRKHPPLFGVNSGVLKDDESETKAKTNSGQQVHPLLVRNPLLACTEYAQSWLFAHYVHRYTRKCTSKQRSLFEYPVQNVRKFGLAVCSLINFGVLTVYG